MTASKIRFLEEKGLINPQRTPAGYRQYAESDVERLRFVLALQRDQYLPLKVIKDYLDAIDRGERPENLPARRHGFPADRLRGTRLGTAEPGAPAERGTAPGRVRRQRPAAGIPPGFGLIGHVNGKFDEHALQVARACVQLESHGLEPRHLRPFQAAAEREFGLVERAVATLTSRKDAASHARAAEAAREISDLCLSLHQALVQDRISRMDI